MKRTLLGLAASLVLGAAAAAQTTSYESNIGRPDTPKKGDPKKVVCEAHQDLGSRIAKRRVCLTVEQWNEKRNEQREFAEDIQSGTWGRESGVTLPPDHPLAHQGPQ